MGSLNSMAVLLWSPSYVGILVVFTAAISLFLCAIAPVSFARVGAWNSVRGGLLVLGWILLLSLYKEGFSNAAFQAFSVAAYFGLVGTVVLCLPTALILVRCHRYRMGWFVAAGLLFMLAAVLVAEICIGPEPHNGVSRWLGSVSSLATYCGPAILAFAIGARMPIQREA